MYKINHCYQEFITNREAVIAKLTAEGITLKFLWKNPSEEIIESFKKAPFFQLFFKSDVMFLLLKFENLKWIDIPCIFTKNSKNLFHFDKEFFPCTIMLCNSNTGKLFIYENYSMPEGISKAFVQNIHTQKDLTKKQAVEKVNNVRSSFSADEMARLSLGNAK